MIIFIALSLLLAVAPLLVKSERATRILAGCFVLTQVAGKAVIIALKHTDVVMLSIFRTDTLAVLFHILMTAVLGFALIHSSSYLKAENVTTRSYKAYYTLLMLLAVAITCVYYSDNLAMTRVF